MEDTHGERMVKKVSWPTMRLNPYYNGRYSWRVKTHISLKTK